MRGWFSVTKKMLIFMHDKLLAYHTTAKTIIKNRPHRHARSQKACFFFSRLGKKGDVSRAYVFSVCSSYSPYVPTV